MADIQAAADTLKSGGKVDAVGFCWGGQWAWRASKSVDVDCSVGYYGVAVQHTLEPTPNCPVMLHFADNDQYVPKEAADEVRAAYPDMPIYNYPANHGFNCDRRADYDEAAATMAMACTLKFVAENVG